MLLLSIDVFHYYIYYCLRLWECFWENAFLKKDYGFIQKLLTRFCPFARRSHFPTPRVVIQKGWKIAATRRRQSRAAAASQVGSEIAYSSFLITKSDLASIGEVFVGYGKAARKRLPLLHVLAFTSSPTSVMVRGKQAPKNRVICFFALIFLFPFFSFFLSFFFLPFFLWAPKSSSHIYNGGRVLYKMSFYLERAFTSFVLIFVTFVSLPSRTTKMRKSWVLLGAKERGTVSAKERSFFLPSSSSYS